MTTYHKVTLPNGDTIEFRSNPGAKPHITINGILTNMNPPEFHKLFRMYAEPKNWQPWFAWRPVTTISGRRVWLKRIFRAKGNSYVDQDSWTWYYYGDMFDVLKNAKNH